MTDEQIEAAGARGVDKPRKRKVPTNGWLIPNSPTVCYGALDPR